MQGDISKWPMTYLIFNCKYTFKYKKYVCTKKIIIILGSNIFSQSSKLKTKYTPRGQIDVIDWSTISYTL